MTVGLGVAGLDVTALRVDIVAATDDCTAEPIASQTLELAAADETADGDAEHGQTSSWFVVPVGDVRVCVTPWAGGMPSERCPPLDEVARVEAGQTTELRLVLQCRAPEDGVLDTVISLNEAPRVSQLTLDPGDVIALCESVSLAVAASDADGDALSYAWTLGDPVRLRPYEGELDALGAEATFSASIAGSYRVNVAVDDGHGGATELEVPIQVMGGACARD